MKTLHRILARLQAHWPALLFALLVAATVGLVGMIPPEVFQALRAFLRFLQEWAPTLQDNFAFLLGIGSFYAATAISAGLLGAAAGFLTIERDAGITRRITGAFTMATLTIIVLLSVIFTIYGTPIVIPLTAGLWNGPLLIAMICGLALVLMIVSLSLLVARCDGIMDIIVRMTETVPDWLASAGIMFISLALYSWFTLEPIRPVTYVLSAITASLLALAMPGVIEEARRRS